MGETSGVQDDEVILLAPQSLNHPEKGERPKRPPGSSGAGPGEKQIGLGRYGTRE